MNGDDPGGPAFPPGRTEGRHPDREDLLLQRYLDGELRAIERRELEARLAEEAPLRDRLARIERVQNLVRESDPEAAPLGLGFADRVLAEIRKSGDGPVEESPASDPGEPLRLLRRWTAVAAAILLLLALGMLIRLTVGTAGGDGRLEAEGRSRHRFEREVLEILDQRAERLESKAGPKTMRNAADGR